MKFTELNVDDFHYLLFDIDGQYYTVLQHLLNDNLSKKQMNNKIENISNSKWFKKLCDAFKKFKGYDGYIVIEGENLENIRKICDMPFGIPQIISNKTRYLTLIHEDILQAVMIHIDEFYALKISRFINNVIRHIGDYNFTEGINT